MLLALGRSSLQTSCSQGAAVFEALMPIRLIRLRLHRRSGRIKISDFGISKLVEATTLQAHSLVGTSDPQGVARPTATSVALFGQNFPKPAQKRPYYFAPELVSGDAPGGPAVVLWRPPLMCVKSFYRM